VYVVTNVGTCLSVSTVLLLVGAGEIATTGDLAGVEPNVAQTVAASRAADRDAIR
jgi:hypothetical protein